MNKLPLARNENIVTQESGKEILIYDLQTHRAFNLNETSSIVYLACDGETTFDELRQKHKFTDDLIFLALDELKKENLIADDKTYVSPFKGISRREAIRKVGLATMIALPVISSLVAPTSMLALSCLSVGQPRCAFNNGLQGNCCPNLRCDGSICNPCSMFVDMLVGVDQIPLFTNLCCSGSATTVPTAPASDGSPRAHLTCT